MFESRNHTTVTTLAVSITIIFYSVFTTAVAPLLQDIPGLGFVIGLLTSVGLYLTLFRILTWGYYKYIEPLANPQEAILKEWFCKIEYPEFDQVQERYGLLNIARNQGRLVGSILFFHPEQKKFTAKAECEVVSLNGSDLTIIYHSVGINGRPYARMGIMALTTEGIPPVRMYGVWTDVLPSTNTGEIILQVRNSDVNEKLRELNFPFETKSAFGYFFNKK